MNTAYTGLAPLYDRLMTDVDYDAWAKYISGFMAPGSFVAETACGTGNISIRLSALGHTVTASDISPEMLDIASGKARRAGKAVRFVRQDMKKLSLHRAADAVVCACDGVNYLTSERDVSAFFSASYSALKPDGLLLFDISSRYKLENVLGMNTFWYDGGETAYVWRNMWDEKSSLCEMELSFFTREADGRYSRTDERHVQRGHMEHELYTALCNTGFRDIRVYGFLTELPPEKDCERLFFIARK